MKNYPLSILAFWVIFLVESCGFSAGVVRRDDLRKMNPAQALTRLTDGHNRFLKNRTKIYRLNDQKYYVGKYGAFPPAVILCGTDARVSPELIFNQGLGDVFCLRAPASMVTNEAIGAMEHACRDIGSKVILILMQTHDPFIEATIDNNTAANLPAITYHIRPAFDNVQRDPKWRKWKRDYLVSAVTSEFLMLNVEKLKNLSPILRGMMERGEVVIVSGIYDVETGKISYFRGDE